jgi:hypothetical protein
MGEQVSPQRVWKGRRAHMLPSTHATKYILLRVLTREAQKFTAIISATWGVDIKKIGVQGQPEPKKNK